MCFFTFMFWADEITKCSPVEEGVPEGVEFAEGFLGVDHEGVAGDDALVLAEHDGDESVGGGFGTDPHPGKILLQEVSAERGES